MKRILFLITIFCTLTANAQNYLISFAGTGASNTVGTVKVENLTAGTSLPLNGDDILRLTGTVGIPSVENKQSLELKIYPNPMTNYSTLDIYPPITGDATITINEITGKQVFKDHRYLENCQQEFRISGINSGLYLITIKGKTYQYSGKLFCTGKSKGTISIENVSNNFQSTDREKSAMDYKGSKSTVDMLYTTGDRLRFTGTSGIYTTVITDIPSSDKTITFNFIACTDGDNNNYSIVKIGLQMWMAENLKTTHYTDGTAIPLVSGESSWSTLTVTSKAYCWINDDIVNKDFYGALYTWAAAMNGAASSTHTPSGVQGACPTGWNLPSDGDWYILENYLVLNGYNFDGTTVAPNRIGKALATATGWLYSNAYEGSIGNTDYPAKKNSTGFSARPGCMRSIGGSFLSLERYAYWWTATEYDATNAWNRYLHFYFAYLNTADFSKASGNSVRCVKY